MHEVEFLKTVVEAVVEYPAQIEMFASDSDKRACVASVTSNRNIRLRVRRLLSDELSAKNCKSKETPFESLVFQCLRSRYVTHLNEQVQESSSHLEGEIKTIVQDSRWYMEHWSLARLKCD